VRVEVVLEEITTCPRCALLKELIKPLCDAMGIPFYERVVDASAVAAQARDSATRTMTPEWVEAFGTPEQRRLFKKYAPIFAELSRDVTAPNLIIRWHDGTRWSEIVIKGFTADRNDPMIPQFMANIQSLLRALRKM